MDGSSSTRDRSHSVESRGSSEFEIVPTPTESVNGETTLCIRTAKQKTEIPVEIQESPVREGLLISINPPARPKTLKQSPCDIVLTIDVSGSMGTDAPPPVANPSEAEYNGLTILDLVKHAARTIIETLGEDDRLAIVTFSTDVKVVQKLLPMTAANKDLARKNIEDLRPESMTNLWHGILESIKVVEGEERPDCVPAIMILTDGLPNHMCPSQGYVRKIRSYKLPASLHTFGFGYSLRSGLLKSIAEVGGGNYAFIPDSGMLGTVFVHAVANMQATFATRVSLTLTTSTGVALEKTTGDHNAINAEGEDAEMVDVDPSSNKIVVEVNDVHYGQSRDIFLKYRHQSLSPAAPVVHYHLTGQPVDGSTLDIVAETTSSSKHMSSDKVFYHIMRAELCKLLSSIFPLNSVEEHQVAKDVSLTDLQKRLEGLATRLQARNSSDPGIQSLIEDLIGAEPSGQISLAISKKEFFDRWGKHYLLSILNAHQKQICNSFKDNGPLQYGSQSVLFKQCRDALDKAFDSLPPPKPSRLPRTSNGHAHLSHAVNMKKYNRKDNPCFTGECRVKLADGTQLPLTKLRPGMLVRTRRGSAKVAAVVATKVSDAPICIIDNLRITPYHPVFVSTWRFPVDVTKSHETYSGELFSVLLEQDKDSDAHTIEVEGHWATTLGHGITDGLSVLAHAFFGNHNAVVQSFAGLPAVDGVLQCAGTVRDETTGLVCGFRPRQLDATTFYFEPKLPQLVAVA